MRSIWALKWSRATFLFSLKVGVSKLLSWLNISKVKKISFGFSSPLSFCSRLIRAISSCTSFLNSGSFIVSSDVCYLPKYYYYCHTYRFLLPSSKLFQHEELWWRQHNFWASLRIPLTKRWSASSWTCSQSFRVQCTRLAKVWKCSWSGR